MHIETDRAVALLGFALSPGSQAARRATPATPRSQVARGALIGEITAIWVFLAVFCQKSPRSRRFLVPTQAPTKKTYRA